MFKSRVFNVTNMSFNAIRENKILAIIFKITVFLLIILKISCHKKRRIQTRGSRKFIQRGPSLTTFFWSWWGMGGSKPHYIRAINGPANETPNGVSLADRWWLSNIECWLGSFVIFRWCGPVLLKKPTFLWGFFFREGVRTPGPPLDPSLTLQWFLYCTFYWYS